jgi:hypothetical protein
MEFKIYFNIILILLISDSNAQTIQKDDDTEIVDIYIIENGSSSTIMDSILYVNVDSLSADKFVFVPVSNLQKQGDSNLINEFKTKYIGIGIIEDLDLEIRHLQSLLNKKHSDNSNFKIQTLSKLVESSIEKRKSINVLIDFFIENRHYLYLEHFDLFVILQNIELNLKWYGYRNHSQKTLYSYSSNSKKFLKYCSFLCDGVVSFYNIDSSFKSSILIDHKYIARKKLAKKLKITTNQELYYINLSSVMKMTLLGRIPRLNVHTTGVLYYNSIYNDYSKLFGAELYSFDFLNSGLRKGCRLDYFNLSSITLESCSYDDILKINLSDYTYKKYIAEISGLFKTTKK